MLGEPVLVLASACETDGEARMFELK
jgi:hypothetical protein